MNKMLYMLTAALLVCSIVFAAQDTDITPRELRDPKTLETWLEANASDAESRLTAAGATATSAITLTNASNAGACSISAFADGTADAGDYSKILLGDNGGLVFQTDKAVAGTLATKFTIGEAGRVTLVGNATLDNDTSATELNITETAVKLTANATITGTLGVTGVATFTAMPKLTTTNAPGAVVAAALTNLPTNASTNALFFTITVGSVNYAVPMYALP